MDLNINKRIVPATSRNGRIYTGGAIITNNNIGVTGGSGGVTIDGNGFVKASGTTIYFDNETYQKLSTAINTSNIGNQSVNNSLKFNNLDASAYSLTGHTHAQYSITGHTHTGVYQPVGNYVLTNDSRLSDARPASDVYSWAKASVKPTYNYSEVGAAPLSHTHPDYSLSGHTHSGVYQPVGNYIVEGDARLTNSRPSSDVYSWAKASTKPTYTYNEVGAAPTVHTHSEYQSVGSYVLTSDSRLSDARIASDVYAWAKASTKPSYNFSEVGAASVNHTHAGVYQPVGNYLISDNFKIGGVNLLHNSKEFNVSYPSDSDNYAYFYNSTVNLEANTQYVVSGICPDGLVWSTVHGALGTNNATLWLANNSNGYHQIISDGNTATGTLFTIPETGTYSLRTNVYKAGNFSFKNIKIENATKASNWTPALDEFLLISNISDWAKASVKPTYNYSEVGAASVNHTHTGVYQPVGSYQTQLNGTGLVKANGTTISYDSTTYQPASTAINTSNIASQSVNYASNAGMLDGYDSTQFAPANHTHSNLNSIVDNTYASGTYQGSFTYTVPWSTYNAAKISMNNGSLTLAVPSYTAGEFRIMLMPYPGSTLTFPANWYVSNDSGVGVQNGKPYFLSFGYYIITLKCFSSGTSADAFSGQRFAEIKGYTATL